MPLVGLGAEHVRRRRFTASLPEKIHGSGRCRPEMVCRIRQRGSNRFPVVRFGRSPKRRSVMKLWTVALCLLAICGSAPAKTMVWMPAAGHAQIPLWPGTAPDAQPMPGPETEALRTEHLIAGKPWMAVTNVTRPTMTVYPPEGKNTGAAVVVFPGGGFEVLAID